MSISYKDSKSLPLNQVLSLYEHSFIEQKRPIDTPKRIQKMLDNATFIISAWKQEQLIGLCRCLSDYSYVTYISDIAVHPDFQKQGIGQTLIEKVKEISSPDCKLVVLSNTHANNYYPHIGFTKHNRAWVFPAQ